MLKNNVQTTEWLKPQDTDTDEEKKHKEGCLEALNQIQEAAIKAYEQQEKNVIKE